MTAKNERNRFPHLVAFRVDGPTHTMLSTLAETDGTPVGVWVRTLVLKAVDSKMKAPRIRRAAANAVQLDAILNELRTQGRNINQIARGVNTTGSSAQIQADTATMGAALEALMARILDLLRIDEDA